MSPDQITDLARRIALFASSFPDDDAQFDDEANLTPRELRYAAARLEATARTVCADANAILHR